MAATVPRDSRPRGVTAAFILGSIFPDADIVLFPRWFDVYFLHVHPAVSHALAWSVPEAIVFALLLKPLVRGSRLRPLAIAGWIGILGHILSDCADGSDIALFAPWSQTQYGWHLFGMAEPYILVPLAAVCFVAWIWPTRARPAAAGAFALLAVILLGKAITQQRAIAAYVARVADVPARREIVPVLGRLSEWQMFDEVGSTIRSWQIDVRSGAVELVFERDNADGPLIARSRELPMVRDLLTRTRIQLVRIERREAGDVVLWSDARMCGTQRCDVSFGGLFAPSGTVLSQVIRIGEFQQLRPLWPR